MRWPTGNSLSALLKWGIAPTLYCLWATLAICLAIALAGLTSENMTRLLVIGFLFGQVALRTLWICSLPCLPIS